MSTATMQTDDTNFSVCGEPSSDLEISLNYELENINKWLLADRFSLNVQKSEYVIVGSHQKILRIANKFETEVSVGSKKVKRVTLIQSLGIIAVILRTITKD